MGYAVVVRRLLPPHHHRMVPAQVERAGVSKEDTASRDTLRRSGLSRSSKTGSQREESGLDHAENRRKLRASGYEGIYPQLHGAYHQHNLRKAHLHRCTSEGGVHEELFRIRNAHERTSMFKKLKLVLFWVGVLGFASGTLLLQAQTTNRKPIKSQMSEQTRFATVTGDHVNVRAAAKATSEVLLQLSQGDRVELAEPLPAAGAAETVVFVKIQMPPTGRVWLHKTALDAAGTTVVKTDVRARAGPGTSYTVVGKFNKGEAVQPEQTQDDWVKLRPTTNCFAFTTVKYLQVGDAPTPKKEAPKVDVPKVEPPKVEPPKVEALKVEPTQPTPMPSANQTDSLEMVSISPTPPAVLKVGESMNFTVRYCLSSCQEASILPIPYRGKGELTVSFYLKEPAIVNEIRVVMMDNKTNTIQNINKSIRSLSIPIRAEWRAEGTQVPTLTPNTQGGFLTSSLTPYTPIAPNAQAGPQCATKEKPWANSLGMKFVPVPGTEGLFSVWDTRVQDYQTFVNATSRSWEKPDFEQGPTHPAVMVSWEDAKAFCEWLTQKERREGQFTAQQSYRLPTDAEWSAAVGLENETGSTPKERNRKVAGAYPWGTQWPPPRGAGNYHQSLNVDSFENTAPVGSFAANKFGLYDLGGNVSEWCEDWYDSARSTRVLRGGSWINGGSEYLLSSKRLDVASNHLGDLIGFRLVLIGASSR
ncbi:MAG: SUMF1/EgtB/PvdO family nonheme iron enzyme [Verrucomicrobia bacterium]|nr:SUMF1/EgtB/PvdO family nonheme iron enzyme [Verrucomicrobiota bacterium]